MADYWPRFEAGQTKEFTIVYSDAPGTTPVFNLHAGSAAMNLIHSATATASTNGTAFSTFFTLPNTERFYRFSWTASYAAGPDVVVGIFKTVRVLP